MVKSWLSVPESCPADWDGMPRGEGGRIRHCSQCELDLLDTTRMTAAEVDAAMRAAAGRGEKMPCINLWTRAGVPRFADSPDVPLTSLRRRGVRAAAAGVALAALACGPKGGTENPHDCRKDSSGELNCDFDDDHVDGEVLSPHGANMMSRGRARHAPLYAPPPTLHDEAFGPEPGSAEAEAEEVGASPEEGGD